MLSLSVLNTVLALAQPPGPPSPAPSPAASQATVVDPTLGGPIPSQTHPQNGPAEPREGRCDARIDLQIVEANSHEPLPDVRVEIRPPGSRHPVYLMTDAYGHVRLDNLCSGAMRVAASESHHVSTSRVLVLDPSTTMRATIELAAMHDYHADRVVVVHGTGPETMAASEDIAGSELARTRGEGLADAVSSVAGVTTMRGTAGGLAKPIIRGQVGRRNLIIFDGVRHEGQKWGIDHAPEIDPYAAGRITVIKGAATTRFGPDAIGGALLLDPRPLPRTPGIAGEATSIGSANALGGGGAVRLDHAPAWGRGFAYRAEGNLSRHRAVLTPDYPLDNTGALSWNAGGRLGYLSGPFDVVAGYRILRSETGICSCLRVSTPEEFQLGIDGQRPPNVELYSPQFAIERAKQQIWHHLASVRGRVELGRAGELHTTYAYQFNDRDELDIVRENITGPQLSFHLGTHTGELRYEHSAVPLGSRWALAGTIGGQATHQINDFDSAATLVPDYEQFSGGAFAVERFVHERFELEIGGRYEGMQRTAHLEERDYLGQSAGGRLDPAACVRTSNNGAACKQAFHTPSATLGVLAQPIVRAPELDVRIELNSSARIPAIDEHHMNGAAPSFPILGLGDSRLGVERTWGAATTVRYDGAWLHADVSGYGNYIDEYIYFRPEPQTGQCAPLTCTTRGPLPVFAFRPVDALFVGGELHVDLVAPRLPFEVSGNAAWVRAFDLTNDDVVTLIPADRYELAGRYVWPETEKSAQGFLEVSGTYVAQQHRYDEQADFAPPPPAFVLLGAAAGLEFPFDRHVLRLGLEGNNLLNQRYREYTSLLRYFADEPGWSVKLRMGLEFDIAAAG